ncbi:ribbon-helix-helix domain-containing protein [Sneathiella chinensis]
MSKIASQTLINRNITLKNPETGESHRTSIRLEKVEWDALRIICRQTGMTLHQFCMQVERDPARTEHSRTSRIRSAILGYFLRVQSSVTEGSRGEAAR